MVPLPSSIPRRYATPSPGLSLRRRPFLVPSLRLLTRRLKTWTSLGSMDRCCAATLEAANRTTRAGMFIGAPLLNWAHSYHSCSTLIRLQPSMADRMFTRAGGRGTSPYAPSRNEEISMKRLSQVAVVASLDALAGCYHATIDTGLTPSTTVIDKSWASGWLWGLVPPSAIETAKKCPQGVAKVETQHSFLNQLVSALTGGIYSPMAIKVTCAQSGHASAEPGASEIDVPPSATPDERKTAVQRAAELSLETGSPVFLRF